MSRIDIVRQVNVHRSPRVAQIQGMFDLPLEKTSSQLWHVDLDLPNEWSIGLIVGPSGSGKSTVAAELFGDCLVPEYDWSPNKSVVDDFPLGLSIKDITGALSSVGFSSPPAWLRPYSVLSNGEKFRAMVARAIIESDGLFVIDEFTSVVDRRVAKIGSAAIQKAVRRREKQFIAVTCHYDVVDWLDPDWVYEPHTNKFYRRSLQGRPEINLSISRTNADLWDVFRKHHYLDTALHKSAHCWAGYLDNSLALFGAVIHFPHPSSKRIKREHRIVCLPDYQGVGAGNKFSELLGSIYTGAGFRYLSTTTHPAMTAYRAKSGKWNMIKGPSIRGQSFAKGRNASKGVAGGNHMLPTRIRSSFEYVGGKLSRKDSIAAINALRDSEEAETETAAPLRAQG